MQRDTQAQFVRLANRNNKILLKFRIVRKANPKWTVVAVIEEVADAFYLSPSTITHILKQANEPVPCVDTIAKYTKQLHLF
jgi:hypothetical protein